MHTATIYTTDIMSWKMFNIQGFKDAIQNFIDTKLNLFTIKQKERKYIINNYYKTAFDIKIEKSLDKDGTTILYIHG